MKIKMTQAEQVAVKGKKKAKIIIPAPTLTEVLLKAPI